MKLNRGSISVYMAFVLPVMLVGMMTIGLKIYEKQSQQSILTEINAVSDVQMTFYNVKLFNEYRLLAYDVLVLNDLLTSHKFEGQINSQTTFEVKDYALSVPEYFSQAVIAAAKIEGVEEIARQMASFTKSYIEAASSKEIIESNLYAEETVVETIDVKSLKNNLASLNSNMSTGKLNDAIEVLSASSNQIIEALINEKMSLPNESQTYYKSYAEKLKSFSEILSNYKEDFKNIDDNIDDIKDHIKALNKDKKELIEAGKSTTNISEHIRRMKESLDEARESMEKLQNKIVVDIESFEAAYLDGGDSDYRFLKKLKEGVETLKTLRPINSSVTAIFQSDQINDFTISDFDTFESGDFSKILLSEYCLGVLVSHDPKTIRNFDMTGMKYERDHKYQYEIEYILGNSETDMVNDYGVKLKVFGIREVMNISAIVTSGEAMASVNSAVSVIPLPWQMIMKPLYIIVLGAGESVLDVNALLKGEAIPLYKPYSAFRLTPKNIFANVNQTYDGIKLFEQNKKVEVSEIATNEIKLATDSTLFRDFNQLYYEDYLRGLLYLQDERQTQLRLMRLIEYNLNISNTSLEDMKIGHHIAIRKFDSEWFELERMYE